MNAPDYMNIALEEARAAAERGEVPIGAVLVGPDGAIVARNGNRTLERCDPSAHAEMLVIREGCQKAGAQRIPGHDLYVTLEPCTMCAGAVSFARIRVLHIGAKDPKGGAVWHGARFYDQPTCHHRPQLAETPLDECGQILKDFFKARRE
jgi:tRNA(Arg) A34 adenosine deaminase TadA